MSAQQLSEEQKAAQIKKAKEAEAAKEAEQAKSDFVRRDTRPGVYSTSALGGRIIIKDRQHYRAKNKKEIDFFNADPEIVVFNPGKKKEKNK